MRRVLIAIVAASWFAPAGALAAPQSRSVERSTERKREQQQRVERRDQRRRDNRVEEVERTTRTLNIGPDGEIDVTNISGDMTVTRGGGNSATVEIIKTARAETAEDAKALLGMVTVDVFERGPRGEIKTRYPSEAEVHRRLNRRNINVDVDFNITVPQQARVVLHSISGNFTVRDVSGAIALDTISGNIKLANTGRTATAKTISGNVEVADTTVDGSLTANSISGTIAMRKMRARGLNLSTVSGEIQVEDVTSERVDAQSVSGDLRFMGDLQENGRYEFTSHSGSVRLALGSKSGFQVEATSFSGSIQTDFPLTVDGGRRPGRSLRGRHGSGSALLDLTSFSGSIVITKR